MGEKDNKADVVGSVEGAEKPKVFPCSKCGMEGTSSKFTSSEWRKGDARKCKKCAPRKPKAESSEKAAPASKPARARSIDPADRPKFECAGCKAMVTSARFLSSEWRKGEGERKCRTCVPPPPKEERTCATCSATFLVPASQEAKLCSKCERKEKREATAAALDGAAKQNGERGRARANSRPKRPRRRGRGSKDGTAPAGTEKAEGAAGGATADGERKVYPCAECGKADLSSRFTTREWRKGDGVRKCKKCAPPPPKAKKPAEEKVAEEAGAQPRLHLCEGCKEEMISSRFSRLEWKKGPEKRRCKKCVAASQPAQPAGAQPAGEAATA